MARHFLAVAGNIGAGKSSFTDLYALRTGARPAFEAVEENPYLADFYRDMERWGFHSQVYFLTRRIRQHHALLAHAGPLIQDRTIYEDAEVFARNLHLNGKITDRDWQTYHDLYEALSAALHPPDLIVYLRASVPVLRQRIGKRGRDFEQGISDDYLTRLNELYDRWAQGFKATRVLTIETDALDFVARPTDFDQLVATVQAAF